MVTVRAERRAGRVRAVDGSAPTYPPPMDAITGFDPSDPLPGMPDPWASSEMPGHRDGPPFHMTEMIAAEPAIAGRILELGAAARGPAAELASEVWSAVRTGQPVVITGCGTSEHGALAAAEILRDAAGSPLVSSAQAFELAQDPPASGLVIAISHEGGTAATNAALAAARRAGARTALITVSQRAPGAAFAELVVETGELDQSWCHTVGYLSPIAVAAAVAGHLTRLALAPADASALVAGGLTASAVEAAERIAASFAELRRIVVLATGADRTAGRELVLKVEEGAWLPAAYRDLETFLHGHLAATDAETGVVVIAVDRRAADARLARVRGALAAANVIGMPTAAILTTTADRAIPADLTSVGRIVVPDAPADVPAAVAALLGSATALQTLTERLARARGINPDPIHRDVDRYLAAADAADATD